jgi:hypothetical protein
MQSIVSERAENPAHVQAGLIWWGKSAAPENRRYRKKPLTAKVAKKDAKNAEKGRNRNEERQDSELSVRSLRLYLAIFAVKSFQEPPCQ